MSSTGYLKLYRKVTENEFYFCERFSRMQAWFDLLLLATYKERTVFIRDVEISLKSGELCYSLRSLAKRWQWNVKTVMRFLSILENRGMLEQRKTHITTVITIRNWHRYQSDGTLHGTPREHCTDTNKKAEKGKNVGKLDGASPHCPALSEPTLIPDDLPLIKGKASVSAEGSTVPQFIGYFCEQHRLLTGAAYVVKRGRDHAAAKELVAALGIGEAQGRTVRYLERPDEWTQKHGFTISNLLSVVNSLAERGPPESDFAKSQQEAKKLQEIRAAQKEEICRSC